jgi:hypothetical protein
MVRRAGFAEARVEQVTGVFRFGGFEEYWSTQREVSGRFAALLSSLPAGDVDAIRTALHELAAPYKAGEGYALPTLAMVVGAR